MRDPNVDIEYVFVEPPPIFTIEDIVYKCTVARAHPHTDDDLAWEIEQVLHQALIKFANERNMSVGYSRVTQATSKEI